MNIIEKVEARYRNVCEKYGIGPENGSYLRQDGDKIYCIDSTDAGEIVRWEISNEELRKEEEIMGMQKTACNTSTS